MSTATPAYLGPLPIEVVRRIMHHAPFESDLNLRATSRALRLACDDWFVFCNMSECDAASRNPKVKCRCSRVLTPARLLPWKDLRLDGSMELWGSPISTVKLSVARWLPSLLARHHPLLLAADIDWLLEHFDRANPAEEQAFLFCVWMQRLSPTETSKDIAEGMYPDLRSRYGLSFDQDLDRMMVESMSKMIDSSHGEVSRWPDFWPRDVSGRFIMAYRVLIVFATELRAALAPEAPNRFFRSGPTWPQPRPPTSVDIPLLSLQNTASGFPDTHVLNTCHVSRMTDPQYLEDGSWSGYFNYQFAQVLPSSRPTYLPAIHNICFQATSSGTEEKAVVFRSVKQQGFYDEFWYVGRIWRDSGMVEITERHQYDYSVFWQGVMTPFGIFASLGGTVGGGGHCWLWLWKDSWTRPGDKQCTE